MLGLVSRLEILNITCKSYFLKEMSIILRVDNWFYSPFLLLSPFQWAFEARRGLWWWIPSNRVVPPPDTLEEPCWNRAAELWMTIYSSWRAVEFPKRRSNLKIWNTAQCVQVQEKFKTNTREIVLKHFELFGMSGRLSRLTWTNFLLRIPFSRIHHGGKNAHRGNMSQNATRWTVRAHTIEGR